MCHTYAAMKKEDSVHVAERKIVSVKFLINGDTDERDVFTKAMIKEVYDNWSRSAAIKFQQNIPRKAVLLLPLVYAVMFLPYHCLGGIIMIQGGKN